MPSHNRTRILVTGAGGFIGQALVNLLSAQDRYIVRAAYRQAGMQDGASVEPVSTGEMVDITDWSPIVEGVDTVLHTAGRAHIMGETAPSPLQEYRRVNVEVTLSMAAAAAACGVRRFVFLSSIGVNGGETHGRAFDETMVPQPHADYALSKLEAEEGLRQIAKETGMEVVIIRPTLVYAANAPGNFARLLRVVKLGMPLPFALVRNQRSFISLENLLDFIECCITHPAAANETFVISDGEDVSTPQLLKALAQGMGRRLWLVPLPVNLLVRAASLVGKSAMCRQLCGSLQVDISKARSLLGWRPPLTVQEALAASARNYSAGQ